ncbi:MAG: hypothetical protein J6Q05_05645 [Elusimicrobiaceae bacterium]|nr:hypothetical protein [Elusimicrobiaceae bacterium]
MKIPATAWTPTLKWHITCAGVCTAVAVVLLGTLWLASVRLPAPYQPRTPAHGTTPWND